MNDEELDLLLKELPSFAPSETLRHHVEKDALAHLDATPHERVIRSTALQKDPEALHSQHNKAVPCDTPPLLDRLLFRARRAIPASLALASAAYLYLAALHTPWLMP